MPVAHLLPAQLRDNSDILKHPPDLFGGNGPRSLLAALQSSGFSWHLSLCQVFPASEDISEKVSPLPAVKSSCLLRKEGKFFYG